MVLLLRPIPPEELYDRSPLIRDSQSRLPKHLGEKQVYKLVHSLYHRAGLLKKNKNGGYELRVHSIRKFFKTQLMALGVGEAYVDYSMGHKGSTYHDIHERDRIPPKAVCRCTTIHPTPAPQQQGGPVEADGANRRSFTRGDRRGPGSDGRATQNPCDATRTRERRDTGAHQSLRRQDQDRLKGSSVIPEPPVIRV